MSARDQALKQTLDEDSLAKALKSLLPRKNNYCAVNYPELLSELQHFGVRNRGQLRKLVLRNVREAVRIDRDPLDELNARIYREELGNEKYLFLDRRQMFFGWEGLMRVVMELEFGDRYREFAEKRDHASHFFLTETAAQQSRGARARCALDLQRRSAVARGSRA